jgi:hypothetical protein
MDKPEAEIYSHWFWGETYVFKCKNTKDDYPDFVEFFRIYQMDSRLEEAKKNKEYKEVNLYPYPGREFEDAHSKHTYYLTYLLNEYFRDVFDVRHFRTGFMGKHRYNRVILTKPLYAKIMNFINENELLHLKDLLIELIAIAQDTYIDDVLHYVDNGFEKTVAKIDDEIEKLGTLFGIVSDENMSHLRNKTHPPELISITAKFDKSVSKKNPEKSITLTDSWIIRDFIKYYMQYFEHDLPYKGNWRKSLEHYGKYIYRDATEKLNFNFRLSASMYNMLTLEKIICDGTSKDRTKILRLIVNFFDFALIPFKTKEKNIELTNANKIGHVRNYIKRHLKDLNPSIAYLTMPPEKDRLNKYFDPNFISLGDDDKGTEEINTSLYLIERFRLKETLFPDLCHLINCLKYSSILLSHQLLSETLQLEHHPSTDFTALRKLVETLKVNGKIKDVSFHIEGDKKQYHLSEELSLYLLEQSIKSYMKTNYEDFEIDIIKGKVSKESDGLTPYNFRTNFEKKLNKPQERFFVSFTKSFINFIDTENGKDIDDPERNYKIIGIIFQNIWFFRNHLAEDLITEKVKHWHHLSGQK